ncbi:Ribosomal protein S19, mitochondrial [Capsicum annuum]|nr:Ribosomal protein S19, mitochondrial [Capsicum annuum]KAF3651598.1 Ribosomal protein S19, mitochondrial [Capsicum annuum]
MLRQFHLSGRLWRKSTRTNAVQLRTKEDPIRQEKEEEEDLALGAESKRRNPFMPRRSIWKGSFVDAFLLRMKKKRDLLFNRKIWSLRSSMRQRRALRQFTLSTGKSAGRNSLGRIMVFHREGGSKRLHMMVPSEGPPMQHDRRVRSAAHSPDEGSTSSACHPSSEIRAPSSFRYEKERRDLEPDSILLSREEQGQEPPNLSCHTREAVSGRKEGMAIAENALNRYLAQMERKGTRQGDLRKLVLGLNGFGWHRSLSSGGKRCISGTGGIGQDLRE